VGWRAVVLVRAVVFRRAVPRASRYTLVHDAEELAVPGSSVWNQFGDGSPPSEWSRCGNVGQRHHPEDP
jgi:hypothetical protein